MARNCRPPIPIRAHRLPCPAYVQTKPLPPTQSIPLTVSLDGMELNVPLGTDYDTEETLWCVNEETRFRVRTVVWDEETQTPTETITWYNRPPDAGGTAIAAPALADTVVPGVCCEEDPAMGTMGP